jgi:hypothetical protein
MNIILRDPNGCVLYGQEVAEHVCKTGRPLETYIVENLHLNNFVAFVYKLLSSIHGGPRVIRELRDGGRRGAETTADRRVRPSGAYRKQCKNDGAGTGEMGRL